MKTGQLQCHHMERKLLIKTITEKNYEWLEKLAPEIFSGQAFYMEFHSPDKDANNLLTMKCSNNNEILMTQYRGGQDGDQKREQTLKLIIDRDLKTAEAISHIKDGLIYPVYKTAYPNYPDRSEYNSQVQNELNNYLRQWLVDIHTQRYQSAGITYITGQRESYEVTASYRPMPELITEHEQNLYGHLQRLIPQLLVSENYTAAMTVKRPEGIQNYLTIKPVGKNIYNLDFECFEDGYIKANTSFDVLLRHDAKTAEILFGLPATDLGRLSELETANHECAQYPGKAFRNLAKEDYQLIKEISPEMFDGEAHSVNFIGPDDTHISLNLFKESMYYMETGTGNTIDETIFFTASSYSRTVTASDYIIADEQVNDLAEDIQKLTDNESYWQLVNTRLNQRLYQAQNVCIKTDAFETLEHYNSNVVSNLIPQILNHEADQMIFYNYGNGEFYEFERQANSDIQLSLYTSEETPKRILCLFGYRDNSLQLSPLDRELFVSGVNTADLELAKLLQSIEKHCTMIQANRPEQKPESRPKM